MPAYQVIFLRFVGLMAGFLTLGHQAQGQSTELRYNLRRYVADVQIVGERTSMSGVLFDLTDTTLILAPIRGLKPALGKVISQHGGTMPPTDSLALFLPLKTYRYTQIRRLSVHRRGHAGKGFLFGAGLGIAIGLISGDDPPAIISFSAPQKAIILGFFLSMPGMLVGAAMTQTLKAGQQPISSSVPSHFRKYTIVEQVKKESLYTL